MSVRIPGSEGVNADYQAFVASLAAGAPAPGAEIFIKELEGLSLVVKPGANATSMPQGITAMRDGKALTAAEYAEVRQALKDEARWFRNNTLSQKDKDGKALTLEGNTWLKDGNFDGKPEVSEAELVGALAFSMLAKADPARPGPAFDGAANSEDLKVKINPQQAGLLAALLMDEKLPYVETAIAGPVTDDKPVTIANSALLLTDLYKEGILKAPEDAIDDKEMFALVTKKNAVGDNASTVKTVISDEQAKYIIDHPEEKLPNWFYTQIFTRLNAKEMVEPFFKKMGDAGKPETSALNFREFTAATDLFLRENHKKATGKDVSALEALLGSGLVKNDWPFNTPAPATVATTAAPASTLPAALTTAAVTPTSVTTAPVVLAASRLGSLRAAKADRNLPAENVFRNIFEETRAATQQEIADQSSFLYNPDAIVTRERMLSLLSSSDGLNRVRGSVESRLPQSMTFKAFSGILSETIMNAHYSRYGANASSLYEAMAKTGVVIDDAGPATTPATAAPGGKWGSLIAAFAPLLQGFLKPKAA